MGTSALLVVWFGPCAMQFAAPDADVELKQGKLRASSSYHGDWKEGYKRQVHRRSKRNTT
eukprot:1282483-Amphidinium_carterae.1